MKFESTPKIIRAQHMTLMQNLNVPEVTIRTRHP